jgi:hypothetical protein
MDPVFVANVPDISSWGTFHIQKHNSPRKYMSGFLDITLKPGAPLYEKVLHDIAKAITSSRLKGTELSLWESAVLGSAKLSDENRNIIAAALARGITESDRDWSKKRPRWSEDHFKGHLVEVLLYCLRCNAGCTGGLKPIVFQPSRPKIMSGTPGIDLLEVGKVGGKYYFQIWECKGTDGEAKPALSAAGKQLTEMKETAYQGFMEAYRSLIENPIISKDTSLNAFITDLPHLFYRATIPPPDAKGLAGIVGTGSNADSSHTEIFAAVVGGAVAGHHVNCNAVIIKIDNFSKFRKDLYNHLWNIY